MRNSTDEFISRVQDYLKEAFSERAKEAGIEDIRTWDRGWNAVLSSMSSYPACLTFVDGKKLSDCYTTSYALVIGIAVTGDDNDELERLGNTWADILEDTVRSDWHLGSSCLDSSLGAEISFGVTEGIFCIWMRIECNVDIGGYVYEGESEDALSEMQLAQQSDEDVGSSDSMSQMRNGSADGDSEEQKPETSEGIGEERNGKNSR